MTINARHAKYIEEDRRLDVETAVLLGVRSSGPMIGFPYLGNDGQSELYRKEVSSDGSKRMRCVPSGVDQTRLWGEETLLEAPSGEALVITEGEWDRVACRMAGAAFVASVPSGAANSPEGARSKALRCLAVDGDADKGLKPHIAAFERVVVATDCDHDGLLLRQAIVELIGPEFCWLPEYPQGCKDANDVVRQHGVQALRDMLAGAVPAKHDGFLPFGSVNSSPPRTFGFGLPWLHPHCRLVCPEFLVIGGPANQGKSTVAQCLLFNLLNQYPEWKASIFHGEGDKSIPVTRARQFTRAIAQSDGVNTADPAWQAQRDAMLNDRLAYVAPPQDEVPTFEWLLWCMERQARYRGRKVFLVDPWNEIILEKKRGQSTTEATGEAIIRMKALASRLGLILMVAHHVPKRQNQDEAPTMYDLADSAHWANKSDHVIMVWRPGGSSFNRTQLSIERSKDFGVMGVPGKVWVTLNVPNFQLHAAPAPDAHAAEAAVSTLEAQRMANQAADGQQQQDEPAEAELLH